MLTHVTVGQRVEGGWRCVDDAGRPLVLPADALDADLRDLRVGQRLALETDDAGTPIRASLP